ncbi:hypothetical protein BWQ96_00516 [Gracilariopsis chorda]|uniref:Uncharacterized protein n=1 Tax=Gracilariopsis chorda TaxID=448386 RepID=A0A2V3ICH6_9FLOR|nr:hypothetical protein BWQ96_10563 [Gracilariopsis chorda]PXF49638.1 hypothetical protein BWQ96_00516 [Gracilariopsis chorda]|eukprot:PXF39738.1 hypothetical protein BWQ96_10563 [Gracilariopsis chorda]
MKALLVAFERQHRSLLRDAIVQESGHVQIDTSAGSHITSVAVIEALNKRLEKQRNEKRDKRARRQAAAYKEPKRDVRRLGQLAAQRRIRRSCLTEYHKQRLRMRRAKAKTQDTKARTALLGRVSGVVAPDSEEESDGGMV